MAKADIWMPLYIGDYLADTGRLTTEQHGAYFLLIMDYWRNGAPPDDDAVLANITRTSSGNWKKIRAALIHFFAIEKGLWIHARIEREIKEAAESKGKAQEKATKAAEARWGKAAASNAPGNASSIDQAVLKECPSPSPSPSIKPKSKAESTNATRLPPDWQPNAAMRAFCETEQPGIDPDAIADRFRDYWIAQPGIKGRKADWQATWRNWVRNERQHQPIRGSPMRQTAQDKAKDFADQLTGRANGDNEQIIDIN